MGREQSTKKMKECRQQRGRNGACGAVVGGGGRTRRRKLLRERNARHKTDPIASTVAETKRPLGS